ncbi:DUF5009 domain-containing protein [Bowmanella yangjiangensis]|uniref:DUF5009 domain-containing protein n=1 Tax=Bowmanella yangjiangensis TaxID=2811230 RepID=A0ABS3CUW4_9ALTE|nr:DUF5009 domain-containing protein [Bowmanella yangjiangensis]MBN7819429.1 DUF5009 domain-containing protein [Bowmanella yangjiangensis]
MSTLTSGRILSIDLFRGLTILVMVFVNELAGIADIPAWMKHVAADADTMTFVDLVFPAFLLIVGMSIPFAVQARVSKGDNSWEVFKHGLVRALGLIIIGFYMVNSIGGYDASAMAISIPLWTFCMYISVLLVWCSLPKDWSNALQLSIRAVGIAGLAILWWLFEGPDNTWMTYQWWGILGLIGWAYLFALIAYLLVGQRPLLIGLVALGFIGLFPLFAQFEGQSGLLGWFAQENRNHTHTAMVLAGTLMSLLCFDNRYPKRHLNLGLYILVSGILAYVSCQLWPISKIWATPSWALLSIFFCSVLFALFYQLLEVQKYTGIVKVFEPAANNPLLIYILPYILAAGLGSLGLTLRPEALSSGVPGMLWSVAFALAMMVLVTLLNRVGVRLKL